MTSRCSLGQDFSVGSSEKVGKGETFADVISNLIYFFNQRSLGLLISHSSAYISSNCFLIRYYVNNVSNARTFKPICKATE